MRILPVQSGQCGRRGLVACTPDDRDRYGVMLRDDGIVLELGRMRIADRAEKILADPRIGQLFLGGGLEPARA